MLVGLFDVLGDNPDLSGAFATLGSSSVSRRVSDGIVKPVSISRGRIDKSVAVFFHVHRLKQHAFDLSLLGIFDEHAGRAIESPHLETRPEDSAIGEKLV